MRTLHPCRHAGRTGPRVRPGVFTCNQARVQHRAVPVDRRCYCQPTHRAQRPAGRDVDAHRARCGKAHTRPDYRQDRLSALEMDVADSLFARQFLVLASELHAWERIGACLPSLGTQGVDDTEARRQVRRGPRHGPLMADRRRREDATQGATARQHPHPLRRLTAGQRIRLPGRHWPGSRLRHWGVPHPPTPLASRRHAG